MKSYLLIIGFLLISLLATVTADYIPETGCWTYPDKLICLNPSQLNATAHVESVYCYAIDYYGTGNFTYFPCIANATLHPVTVEVCYKYLPYENGEPKIEGYNPRYNCKNETWEGPAELHIPTAIIPWTCNWNMVDNATKECEINVNKDYEISGFGNDVNGTKAIHVTSIKSQRFNTDVVIGAVIGLIIVALVYRRTRNKRGI